MKKIIRRTGLSILELCILLIMMHCSQDKNPSASAQKVPELITSAVSLIVSSSAQSGGTITSDGVYAVRCVQDDTSVPKSRFGVYSLP